MTVTLCDGSETAPSKMFDEDSGHCPECNRVCTVRKDGTVRKHVPCVRNKAPACKDCRTEGIATLRPAPYQGPRCKTHWRVETARRKLAAHGRHVERTYSLSDELYWGLYEFQGGRCAVCGWAQGKSKRLCVDHNHNMGCDHSPDRACLKCVRALVCNPCNRHVLPLGLGAFHRAADVLGDDPPAQRFLRASNTS